MTLGVALLVVAGLGLYLLRSGVSLSLPARVAGSPRVDDPTVRDLAEEIRQQADGEGVEMVLGMYGDATDPAFLVVAVKDGYGVESQAIFDEFVAEMRGEGALVDPANRQEAERDGTEYICSTGTAPAVSFGVCQWHDDDTTGFVVDFRTTDPPTAMDLTQRVRSAVVS